MSEFTSHIWDFYHKNKRALPWRETDDPYAILVSEIMLQQTQVPRVIPKYTEWLGTFPNFKTLADAELQKVLELWQGLGYNRRGLNLKKTAEIVSEKYDGVLPKNKDGLLSLPGIGPYTAGAVQAFAWNMPVVFIETNIRSVFIHHFFKDREDVADKEILPLIEQTLDTENPREWYYGLMDYGAHLKSLHKNPSRKSKHHIKQAPFKGSNREERSRILKYILKHQPVTLKELCANIEEKHDIKKNVEDLEKEGFITSASGILKIRKDK